MIFSARFYRSLTDNGIAGPRVTRRAKGMVEGALESIQGLNFSQEKCKFSSAVNIRDLG